MPIDPLLSPHVSVRQNPIGSGSREGVSVVQRPSSFNRFEFAVISGLRAGQLARKCTPRVDGSDKVTITAQMEVADGKVARAPGQPAVTAGSPE